jgi:hypothetical protein
VRLLLEPGESRIRPGPRTSAVAIVVDHVAAVRPRQQQPAVAEAQKVRVVVPRLQPVRVRLARALNRRVRLMVAPATGTRLSPERSGPVDANLLI